MPSPSLARTPGLADWIEIGAEGRVRVHTGKVDIGQRLSTALTLLAAEELNVDPARIEVVRPTTGEAPDEGITSGSNSMQDSGQAVRRAAATARRHLVALAARALEADPGALEVEDGLVQLRGTNRSVSYWELFGGRRFDGPVDPDIALKPPDRYRHVGKAATPLGAAEMAGGRMRYLQDLQAPGMLHARVVRPPHYHARLASLDDAAADRLAEGGVAVVRDGSFLAVAGEDEWRVVTAAERLASACRWDMGAGLPADDLYAQLAGNERLSFPVIDGAPKRAPVPPLAAPPAGATATVRARYEKPYIMHGSIGPSAAAAEWRDGRLQVWTHSQGIYVLRAAMADALEIDEAAIRITHVPGAGCYGHNGADDVALDAALVAMAQPGRLVLLKWSRVDEHGWEPYGPAMAMELEASLGADGKVVAWSHESYGDSHGQRPRGGAGRIGAARLIAARHRAEPIDFPPPEPSMGVHVGIHRNLDPLYDFSDRRLVKNLVRGLPLRTSALRTLGAFANVFAIESFMDELAEAAGADPLAFRLAHLSDARGRAVLEACAARLGWGGAPLPEGRGRGLGFAQYKNEKTYAAVGIELEVTDAAVVRPLRAVVAADAGQIVDRAGLAAQLEGGVIQAASWTLYEAVTFDRDGVTSRDWETYPILKFSNVPEVECVLIDRPGAPFLGAGEATSGPTGGAIANAIKAATGLRLRRMPFTPEAIRAAALA